MYIGSTTLYMKIKTITVILTADEAPSEDVVTVINYNRGLPGYNFMVADYKTKQYKSSPMMCDFNIRSYSVDLPSIFQNTHHHNVHNVGLI